MIAESRDRSYALFCRPNVNQPQDALVTNPSDDGQLAEILVERDDGLLMFHCVRENREIAWVARPFRDQFDLVAGLPERKLDRARDARVDE